MSNIWNATRDVGASHDMPLLCKDPIELLRKGMIALLAKNVLGFSIL